MKRCYFILLLGSLLLGGGWHAWADWMGLMNGGDPIDGDKTTDIGDMDIGFDQNNDGVSIIVREIDTGSWRRMFVSKQTYGGDAWAVGGIPINSVLIGDTIGPDMDILPSGKGFCAYAMYLSGDIKYRIYGNSFDNGVFSNVVNGSYPPRPIDTGQDVNAEQPSVARLNDNTAMIAFIQARGGHHRVFSSKWENNAWFFWGGGGWSNVISSGQSIDGKEDGASVRPCLAKSLDSEELFCVFARGGDINAKSIYASRYANGQWYIWGVGGWKIMNSVNSLPVSVGGSLNADYPRLVPLSNGRMLCVYELMDASSNDRIHYTIYNGQDWVPGVKSDFVDVAGGTVSASAPDLAVSPQGKVICVYARRNTENYIKHAYAVEWNGAGWLAMNNGERIDMAENLGTTLTPRVEFDNLGNAICVFQQYLGVAKHVYANYFQGPPFVSCVSPDSGENNGCTTVTVYGNNFANEGTTPETRVKAWLRKDSEPDITGKDIDVKAQHSTFFTAREFTVKFDLNGAKVGDWDLVVENPDGQRYTAENIFGITWPDLDKVYVYPNPIRPGGGGAQSAQVLRFFNLTREAEISIFTLKGEMLRTLTKNDRRLFVEWDLRNHAGRLMAPGAYLYRIKSGKGSIAQGKFMIIR